MDVRSLKPLLLEPIVFHDIYIEVVNVVEADHSTYWRWWTLTMPLTGAVCGKSITGMNLIILSAVIWMSKLTEQNSVQKKGIPFWFLPIPCTKTGTPNPVMTAFVSGFL